MGKLVDMVEPSFCPGPELVLTDRCKKARSEWWKERLDYNRQTDAVVYSMNNQKKTYEEIRAYVVKRNEDYNKEHPYPVDEYVFRCYTDYVPF